MKDKLKKTRVVSSTESEYPKRLKKIEKAAHRVYVRGNIPDNTALHIAIVGTRKASPLGKNYAYDLAKTLAQHNCVVVSGLALGIDTCAHQGCLDGGGQTIAVLANGVDTIYPSSNIKIADRIMEDSGCVLSEYPDQTPAYPNQFIARNKIIAGLSDAIVIIEAPKQSGALSTAMYAREQKKPVYVVPGAPDAFLYQGSLELIRSGARLIRNAKDLFCDIPLLPQGDNKISFKTSKALSSKSGLSDIVYATICASPSPLSVDKLVTLTKLDAQAIAQKITYLIMDDLVKDLGNGTYCSNTSSHNYF